MKKATTLVKRSPERTQSVPSLPSSPPPPLKGVSPIMASASNSNITQTKPFISPKSPASKTVFGKPKMSAYPTNSTSIVKSTKHDVTKNVDEVSISSSRTTKTTSTAMANASAIHRGRTPPANKNVSHITPTNRPPIAPATKPSGPRTPAMGSRAHALGYKKTPASTGTTASTSTSTGGKKKGTGTTATTAAATNEETHTRNYDKDLGLKPADVLKLLTKIKTNLPVSNREVYLTELIDEEKNGPNTSKAKANSNKCALNLLGAFNGGQNSSDDISSLCTTTQQLQLFDKLMTMGEGEESRINNFQSQDQNLLQVENDRAPAPPPTPQYQLMVGQLEEKTTDFVNNYKEHANNIFRTERNQILQPQVINSAEQSLTRFQNSLAKLATTSNESKILRQNLNYKGESIPCAFDSRTNFVSTITTLDKLLYGKSTDDGSGSGSENEKLNLKISEEDLSRQNSELKNHLDKFEQSIDINSGQNEKMAKLLKKCEIMKS